MNISDASDAPDDELVKEVYAYFGLCMYLAQVFETGLVNILTALEIAASGQPIEQNFDRLYVKHEALTFGNLLKGLEKHNFLPMDLLVEARKVKSLRDHLAHRYFREHVLDSMTVGGSHKMIEELEAYRERFSELDRRVSEWVPTALARLGIDPQTLDQQNNQILEEMKIEAREMIVSNWPRSENDN